MGQDGADVLREQGSAAEPLSQESRRMFIGIVRTPSGEAQAEAQATE